MSQQYPYGAYLPPQPPKKSRRTLWVVLGCVGGAILLGAGLLGYFVYDTASKTGRNKVVLPQSFHGLSANPDESMAKELASDMESSFSSGDSAWTPTDTVSSIYHDADSRKLVLVAGAYGNVLLPSVQVDGVLKGVAAGSGATVTGRKDVDPGPMGGRMSCAVTTSSGQQIGLCAWADGSSVVMMMKIDRDLSSVDLDGLAADTRELRRLAEIPK